METILQLQYYTGILMLINIILPTLIALVGLVVYPFSHKYGFAFVIFAMFYGAIYSLATFDFGSFFFYLFFCWVSTLSLSPSSGVLRRS